MNRRKIGATELTGLVLDPGSWSGWDAEPVDAGPRAAAYADDLAAARRRSGVDEAILTGEGTLRGRRVAVACCEFAFLAGSIGVAAAERLVLAVERATRERLPLVVSPTSGGPACRRAPWPSCRWSRSRPPSRSTGRPAWRTWSTCVTPRPAGDLRDRLVTPTGHRDRIGPKLLRERLGHGTDPSSEAAASQARSQRNPGQSLDTDGGCTSIIRELGSVRNRVRCGAWFATVNLVASQGSRGAIPSGTTGGTFGVVRLVRPGGGRLRRDRRGHQPEHCSCC